MELRYAIRITQSNVNVGRADTIEKARSVKSNLEADDIETGEKIVYEIFDRQEKKVIE